MTQSKIGNALEVLSGFAAGYALTSEFEKFELSFRYGVVRVEVEGHVKDLMPYEVAAIQKEVKAAINGH